MNPIIEAVCKYYGENPADVTRIVLTETEVRFERAITPNEQDTTS